MEFFMSFFGAFFAVVIASLIGTKDVKNVEETKEQKPKEREIPKNIGRFSDPLAGYDKYRDENTDLYRSVKRKVENRVGEDSN